MISTWSTHAKKQLIEEGLDTLLNRDLPETVRRALLLAIREAYTTLDTEM